MSTGGDGGFDWGSEMGVEVPDKAKGAWVGLGRGMLPPGGGGCELQRRQRTGSGTFSRKGSERVPLTWLSQEVPSGDGCCPTRVVIGGTRLVMRVPPLPSPLTFSRPHALQINRPPVKLNLLTCQVRPHAEEKKCFDLVTRECPQRDAVAGAGVFDPGAAELRMGTAFLEESIPSGFSRWAAGPPPAPPWHLGTLCPFNPALGISPVAFTGGRTDLSEEI